MSGGAAASLRSRRGRRPTLRHVRLAEAVLPEELVTRRRRCHPEQSGREAGDDVGGPVDSEVNTGDPDGERNGREGGERGGLVLPLPYRTGREIGEGAEDD